MGKSDDSISRRRNRKQRKKQENKRDSSSSKVSARVASIIASKKRRQSGKRRMCQGMCFSLPTPEDPFNDRQGETEPSKKRKRNSKENKNSEDKKVGRIRKDPPSNNDTHVDIQEKEVMNTENKNLVFRTFRGFMGPEIAINVGKPTREIIKWDDSYNAWMEHDYENSTDCPSKFLLMCLNSIQKVLQQSGDSSSELDRPLFANAWGIEFWNCYTNGQDVLEFDGADPTVEQIAWVTSTAADTISMKEKEGVSFSDPFLLYLVPSQEQAYKVRQVCKPLKAFGIHTVSIHSGSSIDHQSHGLKSCEPEYLVSTPERLLELVSLKAVNISQVSLLVVDGLEAPFEGSYFEAVRSTRKLISGNPQTVFFCDCASTPSISLAQKLLGESVPK